MEAQENYTARQIPLRDAPGSNPQRCLSNVSDREHMCYLNIENTEGAPIKIPLGKTQATEKDDPEAHHAIAMVTLAWGINTKDNTPDPAIGNYSDIIRLPDWLRELVYDELKPATLKTNNWIQALSPSLNSHVNDALSIDRNPPLRDGWVYIFKEGYLWRELAIKDAYLKDVDLSKYAGKDHRPATGEAHRSLALHSVLNDTPLHNEIAFSEVQWSWPRLNLYGGMAKDDPRLEDNPNHFFPKTIDAEARQERFIEIDLEQSDTLLVPDPLGLAKRYQHDLGHAWGTFHDALNNITNKDFFDSALLTYHLFFNKTIQPNRSDNTPNTVYKTPTPSYPYALEKSPTNSLYEAREQMDKSIIEDILDVKERKLLRWKIRLLQQLFADFLLKGEIDENTNIPELLGVPYQSYPLDQGNINTCLADYFSGAPSSYEYGFTFIGSWLALLHTDPDALDANLDPDSPSNSLKHPPGIDYTLALLEDTHPLNKMLFPHEGTFDIYQPTTKKEQTDPLPDSENDGTGQFRPLAFACLFKACIRKQPFIIRKKFKNTEHEDLDEEEIEDWDEILEQVPNILDNGLESLMTALKKSMHRSTSRLRVAPGKKNKIMKTLARYMKSTGVMDDVYLSKWSPKDLSAALNNESIILGVKETLDHLSTPSLKTVPQSGIPLYLIGENKPRQFVSLHNNTGISGSYYDSAAKKYFSEKIEEHYFFKMHFDENTTLEALSKTRKAIGILLLVIATINVKEATEALFSSKDKSVTRRLEEEATCMAALGLTLKDTSELLFSEERVSELLNQHKLLNKIAKDEVLWGDLLSTPLQHSFFVFSLIGTYFASLDTAREFLQGRKGEAFGDGISALGNGVLTASQAGAALSRRIEQEVAKQIATSIEEISAENAVRSLTAAAPLLERGLIFFGPYGWLGAILLILGSLLAVYLDDNKLTRWCKHGPFGKNKKYRLNGKYSDWGKEDHAIYACQALMNIIMSPKITHIDLAPGTCHYPPEEFMIEILLQQYTPGQDSLDLHAVWYQEMQINSPHPSKATFRPLKIAKPYKILQIMSEDAHPKITKMQYFYRDLPLLTPDTTWTHSSFTLKAKVRIISHDHRLILPCSEFPSEEDNEISDKDYSLTINPKQPGWAYY